MPMAEVIRFPIQEEHVVWFYVPNELSMKGESDDIHWKFEYDIGCATVQARSKEQARTRVVEVIGDVEWINGRS